VSETIQQRQSATFSEQARLVSSLIKEQQFVFPAAEVELLETHISWVLLSGRFAYKIKKALHFDFLDFTDLERRRFFCEEEIRLNRRLAPQIYLDVISIGGSIDAPEFGLIPAMEYAVRMNRFDMTDAMDRRVQRGALSAGHIDSLATILARFHQDLASAPPELPYGDERSIYAESMQNLRELRLLLPGSDEKTAIDKVRQAAESEYEAKKSSFHQRRLNGFVRECHGDLHLSNIVVIGGEAVPFDGIEFDPALRWIDVIADLAFPYMDLIHFAKPRLASRMLNRYLEQTGDYDGVDVLPFYASGRAAVRAKVHAIRASQQSAGTQEREAALAACRSYLELAALFLSRPRAALIITCGLPGSGKSSFAQAALEMRWAIRIRSDVERKRLFGLSPLSGSLERAGNIYGADVSARTYEALYEIARKLLAGGFSVIVDAAFLKQSERDRFHGLAESLGIPFAIASVQAGEGMLQKRIIERMRLGNDPSEADLGVLAVLQATSEPLLPKEQAWSVEFINDGEQGFAADDPGWKKLEKLLS